MGMNIDGCDMMVFNEYLFLNQVIKIKLLIKSVIIE